MQDAGYADAQGRRPHTATGTGRAGYSNQQVDRRTGKPAGTEGGEDDAHVVAGARAMMRYRRTRATSQDPPGQNGPGGAVAQQKAGWTGQDQYGGQPRAIYQNPNRSSSQQQQLMQQQQMQSRGKSAHGKCSPSLPSLLCHDPHFSDDRTNLTTVTTHFQSSSPS